MRELDECRSEVFRRMEIGIKKRKRFRRTVMACCVPGCICLLILPVMVWTGILSLSDIKFIKKEESTCKGSSAENYPDEEYVDNTKLVKRYAKVTDVEDINQIVVLFDSAEDIRVDNSENNISGYFGFNENIPAEEFLYGSDGITCAPVEDETDKYPDEAPIREEMNTGRVIYEYTLILSTDEGEEINYYLLDNMLKINGKLMKVLSKEEKEIIMNEVDNMVTWEEVLQ